MCIKCGCYGTVSPYGVGGRKVNAAPPAANVAQYNKPIQRLGEVGTGSRLEMEDAYDNEDM
jgi:hypothetical protein